MYNRLPKTPTHCIKTHCTYNLDGICPIPRLNHTKSDAECAKQSIDGTKLWLGIKSEEENHEERR